MGRVRDDEDLLLAVTQCARGENRHPADRLPLVVRIRVDERDDVEPAEDRIVHEMQGEAARAPDDHRLVVLREIFQPPAQRPFELLRTRDVRADRGDARRVAYEVAGSRPGSP